MPASPQGEAFQTLCRKGVIGINNYNNPRLTKLSQNLRRNMTRQERKLWYDFLKTLPVTFHRQKVIQQYILDFYCATAALAIELDGSQHYQADSKDMQRDAVLRELGITVLRYSNQDIDLRFADVCEDILQHLPKQCWPSP